jgi:hypothetical protein
MTLKECEYAAQEMPVGRAQFSAKFPAGEKRCIWLDAYMGLLGVEGTKGFMMTRQIDELFPDLECTEPVEVEPGEAEKICPQ